MKILYGVSSNGLGHINRASIFIKELLKDGHEVHILYTGKTPPEYALKISPTCYVREGPKDIYHKHKVKYGRTILTLIWKIPKYYKTRKELLRIEAKENYDVFFSDLEYYVNFLAKKAKKPCFNINHQNSVILPIGEKPPGNYIDKFLYNIGIKMITFYFTRCYSIDFTDKIEQVENVYRYPLIYKPELDEYDITQGDHFVAYLANADLKRIIQVFSKFPRETFYIYGFDEDRKISNIIFKKTSRTEFLKDLTSAKAVIGNAGFSLTWEVCLTDKLMWTIPYKRQYEQLVNSYRLTKMNRAYYSKEITEADFESFTNWLEEMNYKPSTKLTTMNARSIIEDIYSYLENYHS